MPVTKDAVVFKLTVDSSGAVTGLKAVETGTQKVAKAAKKASGSTKAFGMSLKNLGVSTIALNQATELYNKTMMALNKTWDASIGRSLKLEKNIAEITTLISDSTGMNEKFTESILRMQEQFGSDQTDTALAFYQAISSGAVDAATSNELLITANKLAIGGVTNLSTAVGGLTSIINAYGLKAKDALRVSDALFLGMKFGTTTIEKLSIDLGRVTGLAAATGVSFQEVIAATAAITTGGVRTSEAITQIRSAMVALNKQTGPMQELLAKLGITSIKATIQQKGLVNVLKDIRNESNGTTESLTGLFGRIEAMNAVLALTSDKIGSKYLTIMNEMGKVTESVGKISEEAFQKIAATADFQLDVSLGKLIASFTRLGNVLMDLVVPPIILLVDTVSTLINVFTSALDILILLISEAKAATVVLIGFGIAATGAASGTSALTASWITLTAVMSGIGAKLALATTAMSGFALAGAKIGLITVGVITLLATIELLAKNLGELDKVALLIAKIFMKAFKNIAIVINDTFMMMVLGAKDVMSSLGILPDAVETAMTNSVTAMIIEADRLANEAKDLDKEIADIGSGLDLGFTEKLVGKIREVSSEIASIISGATSKDAEDAMSRLVALTKEQLAALRQVTQETLALQMEVNNIGATRVQQIENERILAQAALKLKRDNLVAEKKISAEVLKQLDIQSKLIDERAKKKTKEAETPEFFNPDMMSNLTGALGGFGESVGGLMTAASSMAAVPLAMIEAANMIVGFFQQLVDAIPAFIDAVTALAESFQKLPETLLKSFSELFKSLGTFVPTLVTGIFEFIFGLFEEVIPQFIEGFLNGFADLIVDIPDMFIRLLTKSIPMLIQGIIEGLIEGIGRIAVAWVHFIVKGGPKILKAIDKMIPLIWKAVWDGLVNALEGIKGFFKDTFSGKDMAVDFMEGIKGSNKDVFAVLDLEQNAAAVSAADKIKDALREGWGLFTALWAILEGIWNQVWIWAQHWWLELEKIWNTVWGWAEHWWLELEKIWSGVWGWMEHWWHELENIWKDVWKWIDEKMIQPIRNVWIDVWNKFDEKVVAPLREVFSGIFDPEQWTKVGTDIWNGLKTGLEGIADFIKDAFKGIDNPLEGVFKVDMKGMGDLENAMGVDVPWANFAGGGVVPGSASMPGNHIANDTVPALLSPDEVVIPRSLTKIPEVMAMLKAIMAGKVPKMLAFGSGGDFNPFDDGGSSGGGDIFGGLDPTKVSINDIEALGDKAIEGIEQLASILSPGDLLKKMADKIFDEMVKGLKSQNGFENGGPVTSTGPAFVHQGEFVLNKKTVDSINASSQSFDRGGSSVNQDFQISVNVAGGESIDEGSLARSIMDEIKEASIQGRFIMSTKGLRTT